MKFPVWIRVGDPKEVLVGEFEVEKGEDPSGMLANFLNEMSVEIYQQHPSDLTERVNELRIP